MLEIVVRIVLWFVNSNFVENLKIFLYFEYLVKCLKIIIWFVIILVV